MTYLNSLTSKLYFILGISMFISTNINASTNFVAPEILEGNKSKTLNGTGYVFFTPSPITENFLKQECVPGAKILDIGTGFSNMPIVALKNASLEYWANDISKTHLDILLKKAQSEIPNQNLNNLTILEGKVPNILHSIQCKFDAILADKVIHFFTPDEIKDFISVSKLLLKKEGKIYIIVASPYSKRYKDILPDYLK